MVNLPFVIMFKTHYLAMHPKQNYQPVPPFSSTHIAASHMPSKSRQHLIIFIVNKDFVSGGGGYDRHLSL